jgi:cysteine synthase
VAAAAGCLLTGREILQQTHGRLHAFVSGAGTGGTIAGVSQALKDLNPHIRVVLADPQGSSLFNKASGCGAGLISSRQRRTACVLHAQSLQGVLGHAPWLGCLEHVAVGMLPQRL